MSTAADTRRRIVVAWILFAVAVVLLVGWPIAALIDWDHIVESHARLGYLIGDIGIAVPLCLASWHGLRRALPWARGVLLFCLGALAYDVTHFLIYLMQEEFASIPLPVYIVVLAVVLVAIAWVAAKEIEWGRGPRDEEPLEDTVRRMRDRP
jgi:hypothetical protein